MITQKLSWFGDDVKRKARAAMESAALDSLEYVLGESNKVVPLDEGTLQRSGAIDFDKTLRQGTVFYDTPYARRLHEHPEYKFQRGRRGKWLESTINKVQTKVAKFLQDRLKAALK